MVYICNRVIGGHGVGNKKISHLLLTDILHIDLPDYRITGVGKSLGRQGRAGGYVAPPFGDDQLGFIDGKGFAVFEKAQREVADIFCQPTGLHLGLFPNTAGFNAVNNENLITGLAHL